jgi:hypothetical protein
LDLFFLGLLLVLPVLVLISGWGMIGISVLILVGGAIWESTASGDAGASDGAAQYAMAVLVLLVLDAALTLGRAGALLARFGGRRRAASSGRGFRWRRPPDAPEARRETAPP